MADVDPVLCIIYLACHVHSGSVRSKSLVDSGVCAQAWASWLIMSGEPPQAGNGAGKSRRRGQWKDCRSVARHVSTVDGDRRGPFLDFRSRYCMPGAEPTNRIDKQACVISLVVMIPRCQRGGPGSIPG